MPQKHYENKKNINLKKINIKINIYYNSTLLDSLIPKDTVNWITKQLEYTSETLHTIEYELLFLMINYSMTLFNYYTDKQHLPDKNTLKESDAFWKKIKMNPFNSIDKVISYINKSPKIQNKIITYSGISYDKYLRITRNDIYETDRFTSSSFDKFHAIRYSRRRENKKDHNNLPYILLELTILPNTKCIYSIYENQIIFPPKIKFKIGKSELQYLPYKDILSKTFSSKVYPIYIVYIEVFN